MLQKPVFAVYLQLGESKQRTESPFRTGTAPAQGGAGETSSSGRDSARFTDGALGNLRKSILQVRPWGAARTLLVSFGNARARPDYGQHHSRGKGGRSPHRHRKLPQGEGSAGEDFRHQPRVAAARALTATQAGPKGINGGSGKAGGSCPCHLAVMRKQDMPDHELPSLGRYLNKVFDFRANVAGLTDSRR